MNSFFWSVLILLLSFLVQMPVLSAPGHSQLASASGQSSASGAGGSYSPQFSANGRFVVFTSHAPNLTTNLNNAGFLNVYSKDVISGKIVLVSANKTGHSAGNNNSSSPSVSSNGQWIAFESSANDLVSGDTNDFNDIFLRDTASGVTTLISWNAAGTGGGNGTSSNPSISPDGRYILFESSAENLVPGDTNQISDLFLRDRLSGTTALVSVGARGVPGSPYASVARSGSASMSSDGKRVVFVSTATNLAPGVTNIVGEVYLRDMAAGVTHWASSNSTINPIHWRAFNPVISTDGRFLVFKSQQSPPPPAPNVRLLLTDLETSKTYLLTTGADLTGWPSMTWAGNWVASEVTGGIGVWSTATPSSQPLRLTLTNAGFGPILSSAGDRLAVLTGVGTNARVGLVVADFAKQTNYVIFAPNGASDLPGTTPCFDPTGTAIVFETAEQALSVDKDVTSDIYLAEQSGSTAQHLVTQLLSTSLPTRPNRTSTGFSLTSAACLSANGRYVAFSTTDTNIYGNGLTNHFTFVVWDTWLQTNVVASLIGNLSSIPAPNPWGPFFNPRSIAAGPVLSLDGRVLAYTAPVPTKYDSDSSSHVFLLNWQTSEASWITQRSIYQRDDGPSTVSSISADNRFVVFQTALKDLTAVFPPSDTNAPDVYIYDSVLRTNRLVNVTINNAGPLPGASVNPLLSSDGRWVLFQNASSLSGSSPRQEMVRDLVAGRTYVLSIKSNGLPFYGSATSHVFSLNSRLAAFGGRFDLEDGNGLVSAIMIYDLYARTNRVVCTGCQNPSLDAAGTWIAYEKLPAGTSAGDVYVQDLQSGQEFLASPTGSTGSTGNGPSYSPLLSSDARYLVFTSKASNLVDNDSNNASDVFVRDRVLSKTVLLSLNHAGTASANGSSGRPSLSADGRTVAFQSSASDLVDGDSNGTRDIFIARLGSGDSDNDQLDDDWELAHFNNLSRDGQGDFDNDGKTDAEEFRAGTNPANNSSVLQVLSLTQLGSSGTTLVWNSVPGRTYRLQYKDSLDSSPWLDFPKTITATSSSTAGQDSTLAPKRFYRVFVVD